MLVLLNLLQNKETPRRAEDIHNHTLELAFNAGFLHEMRAFERAQRFVQGGGVAVGRLERRIGRVRFHMIDAHDAMHTLSSETKLAAQGPFFEMLRDLGREQARDWLDNKLEHVGQRSSVDIAELFA
jgi:NTE family protein